MPLAQPQPPAHSGSCCAAMHSSMLQQSRRAPQDKCQGTQRTCALAKNIHILAHTHTLMVCMQLGIAHAHVVHTVNTSTAARYTRTARALAEAHAAVAVVSSRDGRRRLHRWWHHAQRAHLRRLLLPRRRGAVGARVAEYGLDGDGGYVGASE